MRMVRRLAALGLTLLTAAAVRPTLAQAPQADAPPARRPNLLFLFADDFTHEALGAAQLLDVETPNLDKLAARGVRFTRAYNMGSWTGAVCVASRTMLITGRSLWDAQRTHGRTDAERQAGRLWPQLLHAAGYRTYFTGKWHINTAAPATFDVARHVRPGMPGTVESAYNRPQEGVEDTWRPDDTSLGGFWEGGKHWSEVGADDAVDYLTEAAAAPDQPFFMYIAFNAPHDPRQAPREFVDRYPPERIAIPSSFLPEYPHKDRIGCDPRLRDERLAPFPRTERSVRVHRGEYFALITHLDEQLGRILAKLDESGLAASTWIFFTADHGLAVGNHGLFGKQNMYEHSVRVPFLVAGPGVPAGAQVDAPIYLQDVMPTCLELAGAERPEHVHFHSLLPLVRGETRESSYPAITGSYLGLQRSITVGSHKLIVYPQAKVVRLYDLESDPQELRDLAAQADQRERIAQLYARLRAEAQRLGDSLQLPDEPPPPSAAASSTAADSAVGGYRTLDVEGWRLRVAERLYTESPEATAKALELSRAQLRAIAETLPADIVRRLRQVPLWYSPPYPGFGQKAEYHPDAGWLRANGRRPELARSIEVTNVAIFEAETRRMPWFLLHELAHAYHDQVLGFEHREIEAAYRRALDAGLYASVQRYDGKTAKHYALSNAKEFFAELTESLFGRNDFFPFDRQELLRHDPETARLLARLWGAPQLANVSTTDAPANSAPTRLPAGRPEEAGLTPQRLAQIDTLIAQGIEQGELPGCVVLVARRGRVVLEQAYGLRQVLPEESPMTVDCVFDMASITKPVATATSVMCLVDQGKLRIDDRVAQHIPEFAQHGKDEITILQLLTHQSGLLADNALSDYEQGREEALRRICALDLKAPPGTKFIYSDVGFIVLGELVRRVSGRDVAEFSRDSIFAPLGMAETGYLPAEPLRRRAAPTERQGDTWLQGVVHDPRAAKLGGVAGHAGLFSTAQDLAVYGQMMLGQGEHQGRRVLAAETVERMTAPFEVSSGLRGLGWDKRTGYSINRGEGMTERAFGHGGFTGTVLWIDPGLDLTFVFLSNRLHPDGKGSVNQLAGRIASLVVEGL